MHMKNPQTGRDAQRTTFVESLYNNLRKQTKVAVDNHNKLVALAKNFMQDGLNPSECAELLMSEGDLSRTAAENYVAIAASNSDGDVETGEEAEYSFQFEDSLGNVLSSFDVGKLVTASSANEAMEKADALMQDFDEVTIINVSKLAE